MGPADGRGLRREGIVELFPRLPMNDGRRALTFLRIALAAMLLVHPVTRIVRGTVPGLGDFLAAIGFPLARALAWAITLFELCGGVLLALGRQVRWVTPGFGVILAMGIVLVHGREGWFVVGGGRNGVEFSVTLLVGLATLWLAHAPEAKAAVPRA